MSFKALVQNKNKSFPHEEKARVPNFLKKTRGPIVA